MKKGVISFILFLLLVGCEPNRVFEKNIEISKSNWDMNQPVSFEVTIEDTTSPHDFFINVRNSGHYQFSNLYLFVNTILPGNEIMRDTVELILADADGKWRGSGLGDIWDNRILFKNNVIFPISGTYQFTLYHAMRTEILPGIMDVGIRIQKSE